MNNPSVDRRRLLLGLAAASASAAAIPSAVALEATAEPENPELLRLGDRLPKVSNELRRATNAYSRAYHTGMALWPATPAEVVSRGGGYRDIESDIAGLGIMPDGSAPNSMEGQRPRSILTADQLRSEVAYWDRRLTAKRRKPLADHAETMAHRDMLADKLAIAEDYEAKQERAKAAVGFDAARRRKGIAEKAMQSLVAAIMAEPETTMAGVLIKADALATWHSYPASILDFATKPTLNLAESILRIAGEVST